MQVATICVATFVCFDCCLLKQLFIDWFEDLRFSEEVVVKNISNAGWDQLPASHCGAWRRPLKSPEVKLMNLSRKEFLVIFSWKTNHVSGRFAVCPTPLPSWRLGQGILWFPMWLAPFFFLLWGGQGIWMWLAPFFRLDHKFDLMYAKRAFVHWLTFNTDLRCQSINC